MGKISIIVATDKKGIIGKNGIIPWKCSEDMKHFKEKTTNNIIIMGRKTYESLGNKALKKRLNIVLSKNLKAHFDIKEFTNEEGPYILRDVEIALELCKRNSEKEIFVIGGKEIYDLFLDRNLIDRIYLSLINIDVDNGDTQFEYDESEWKIQEQIEKKDFILKVLIK